MFYLKEKQFHLFSKLETKNEKIIFIEPYLYPEEKKLFYKYLDKSSVYFEFGSGGSTHQAAKRRLKIYSLEISQCWIDRLQKEFEMLKNQQGDFKIDITYLVVDLQTQLNLAYAEKLKYVKMYNQSKYGADFIYIDGKYHLACLMNVYNQIDDKTIVFFHEPHEKSFLDQINQYFTIIEQFHKVYVLKKKSGSSILPQESLSTFERQSISANDRPTEVVTKLYESFPEIVNKYREMDDSATIKPEKKQIWFLWWQRFEKAPEIVKICYKSIQRNFKDGNIIIITEDNYKNYTNIPSHVIQKLKSNRFSLTHFSDILRFSLLSSNGGFWVDSTIFISREVPEEVFDLPYYTIHNDDHFWTSQGKWSGFSQASFKNEIVTKFCNEVLYSYWEKYNDLLDYFLIDFTLLLGYEYIPAIKRRIQAVPFRDYKFHELALNFPKLYSQKSFDTIMNSSWLFKLSYKQGFPHKIENNLTNFGYFYERYK